MQIEARLADRACQPGLGIGAGNFELVANAGLPREVQFGLRFEV